MEDLLHRLDHCYADPPARLAAYAALKPLLAALPTRAALASALALPALLPHLLVSRYYGGLDMQRWPAQATWRQLVARLEAAGSEAGAAAAAEGGAAGGPSHPLRQPSSPLTRAVQAGMALAVAQAPPPLAPPPAQQPLPPSSALPALSPSAAAALAPGAEGVSACGPALVAQHAPAVAAFLCTHLRAARARLHSEATALAALGVSALAPPCAAALPLLAAALDAEALCHTLAELATKIDASAVAPHAPALAAACLPLQFAGCPAEGGEAAPRPTSPAAPAPASPAPAQRPPPWLPRGATPFSALAAVRLAAIVAHGKLLANFEACRASGGSVVAALAGWQGELAVQPDAAALLPAVPAAAAAAPCAVFSPLTISLRQQRSHCAMVCGLLLACAPMHLTEGLVGALCALAQRRLRGEAVTGEGVLAALRGGEAGSGEAGAALAASGAAGAASGGGAATTGMAAFPASPSSVEGGLFLLRELSASFPEAAVDVLPQVCHLAASLAAQAREGPFAAAAAVAGAAAPPAALPHEAGLVLLECLWRVMVDVVKGLGRARVKRHLEALLEALGASAALLGEEGGSSGGSGGSGGGSGGSSSSRGGAGSGGSARGHLLFSAARAALDCAQVLGSCVGRSVLAARLQGCEHSRALLAACGEA
jgi:hypothetical protein